MSPETNKDLAVRFVTTMSDHGGPDERLITDDFAWWSSYHHGVMNIREIKAMIGDIALPPLKMEVIGLAAGDDRVAVEVQGRCELPDGRRYDNNYCFIVVIRYGRVCEMREYCDTKLAADTFAIVDIAENTRKSAAKAAEPG